MKKFFMKFASVLSVILVAPSSYAATLFVDQAGSTFVNGGYTGGNVVQSFTLAASNVAGVDAHYYAFSGPQILLSVSGI